MKIKEIIDRFEKHFPKSYISIEHSFIKTDEGRRYDEFYVNIKIDEEETKNNESEDITKFIVNLQAVEAFINFIILNYAVIQTSKASS